MVSSNSLCFAPCIPKLTPPKSSTGTESTGITSKSFSFIVLGSNIPIVDLSFIIASLANLSASFCSSGVMFFKRVNVFVKNCEFEFLTSGILVS